MTVVVTVCTLEIVGKNPALQKFANFDCQLHGKSEPINWGLLKDKINLDAFNILKGIFDFSYFNMFDFYVSLKEFD